MSDEWGIKTGTLYFHLKELGEMIDQGENKQYILTSKGKRLCKFFIREQDGKAKIEKVDAFTSVARPLYLRLEGSIPVQIILYTLMVGLIIGTSLLNIYLLGPIILPVQNSIETYVVVLINSFIFVFQVGLMLGITSFLAERRTNNVVWMIVMAHVVNMLFVALLIAIVFLPLGINSTGIISSEVWFIVSTLSQATYISIISGTLILGYRMKVERALLIAIGFTYLLSAMVIAVLI